jgi:tRNA threonylcarbamoyl adenosine modification protein YeaZ
MTGSPFILALNATEGLLQIIIARQEADGAYTRLCAQAWQAPSQGAELLAPALADAFQRLHISPHDIGKIAAVRGPGSFTGLRLVLATASGLARVTGALKAGLDYLPLLAMSALRAIPAQHRDRAATVNDSTRSAPLRRAWALTHARRNLVHIQAFQEHAHTPWTIAPPGAPALPRQLCDVLVCSPEEATLYLTHFEAEQPRQAGDPPSLVFGSGLTRNREVFTRALPSDILLLPPSFDHPSSEALLDAAKDAAYGAADPAPLYIRPADAIDNLDRIAASLGLDPEAAKQRLRELTE